MRRTFRTWLTATAIGTAAVCVLAANPARAVTGQPAAPAGYAPPVGMSYACSQATGADATCSALTAGSASTGTTPPAGLDPSGIRTAYGLPSATAGYGQTVAVVAPYYYKDAAADLSAYRSGYGIPACTTASGCFKQVSFDGGDPSGLQQAAEWNVADAQAMDMISAVCPNCHILLVDASTSAIYTTDTPDDGLGAAENEAVALGARFVVDPWSIPEASIESIPVVSGETNEAYYDSLYFDHPGVVITASGGDAGYSAGAVAYPEASPDVIAVGGTTLTPSGGGYTQTAWTGTQSGCSGYESRPAWQTETACGQSRAVNDVAAVADPGDNIVYYDSDYTTVGWDTGGGTDYAAAIVAAAYALAGTPATDATPASYLYANANGLTDITSETNGVTVTCPAPTDVCNAGPGWDGPTGLGTPDGVSAFLASYYQPITPVRFMDTRIGTGATGPVAADGTVTLQIAGVHGIPSANVTAVVLNLTATAGTASGPWAVTVYADGTPKPATTNLDYEGGTTRANLVIAPVGQDGKIAIYNHSTGTVQLVGDVFGYFTSDATAAGGTTYTPVTPTRILNTGTGLGAPKQPLAGGGTLAVQVGGANGIPSGIAAVAINITAAGASANGGLENYADGTTRPVPVSNMSFGTANIAEMAIVPVGADGKIDIYSASGSGVTVNVIGDVVGYFSAGTGGQTYHAIGGARIFDTRQSTPVAANTTVTVSQGTTVVAPSPTMIIDVSAVEETADGDLIIYPAGTSIPGTSNLNYQTGTSLTNLDLAATGGGTFDIYNASNGTTNIMVDCMGYLSAG
jgi:hypothetical protein